MVRWFAEVGVKMSSLTCAMARKAQRSRCFADCLKSTLGGELLNFLGLGLRCCKVSLACFIIDQLRRGCSAQQGAPLINVSLRKGLGFRV